MKSRRWVALCVTLLLITVLSVSLVSCNKKDKDINPLLNLDEEVTIVLASGAALWPEMDLIIDRFETKYPNCKVKYEYIESYGTNLPTRLAGTENKIDVFSSSNIKTDTAYYENCLNLIDDEAKKYLDLSYTNAGVVKNFQFTGAENTQYCIPYAVELRGMYVNKTLLNKYNLQTPTTWTEFLKCCKVLKAAGLIPVQSATGALAQQLLYPYICNSIAHSENYEATYAKVDNIDTGISEMFRDAYSKIYTLVENDYYNDEQVKAKYDYAFNGSSGKSRDFLNIVKKAGTTDVYEKVDDLGNIAFMCDTYGFGSTLAKTKEDYGSEIEYEFIMSPVTEEGGYAYLSPADGLAINKNSDHTDWALEFLDFFFKPENNRIFAERAAKFPNTKDLTAELAKVSTVAERTCTVGEVTFSYPFYQTVVNLMMDGYSNYYAKTDFTPEFLAANTYKVNSKDDTQIKFACAVGPDDFVGVSKANFAGAKTADGKLKYSLDQYVVKLEALFQEAKVTKANAAKAK